MSHITWRERERERECVCVCVCVCVVAACRIKLIATLCSTPICRPRNMDTDHQESNEYWAPPSNMSWVDSFLLSRLRKLATWTTKQWKVISKEHNLSPLMQNGGSRTLFVNSSPSHDSLGNDYPHHLAAPDKWQFITVPLWSSHGPRYESSIPPTLVQNRTFPVTYLHNLPTSLLWRSESEDGTYTLATHHHNPENYSMDRIRWK